jgi:dTMP kinase
MKRGRLIVMEGIDSAGKETQAEKLSIHFKENQNVIRLEYPDPDGPIGRIIKDFLFKKSDLSTEMQFLLYSTDMVKDKEKISSSVREGNIVIADRYFPSLLAYQTTKGFSSDKAIQYAELFEMPKPDIVFYLKISPETSVKRSIKGKQELDRHESNEKFLEKVANAYDSLAEKNVFGSWIVIDGEKSTDNVFDQIKKHLGLK